MARRLDRNSLEQQAWIGDAVLSLYVRSRILDQNAAIDGAKAARMTANSALAGLGEPTAVEAEIGRVYAKEGLAAAFAWIEHHLIPLLEQQEERRPRRAGPAKRK
jgi:23S rRNA maturation mini-RNase III